MGINHPAGGRAGNTGSMISRRSFPAPGQRDKGGQAGPGLPRQHWTCRRSFWKELEPQKRNILCQRPALGFSLPPAPQISCQRLPLARLHLNGITCRGKSSFKPCPGDSSDLLLCSRPSPSSAVSNLPPNLYLLIFLQFGQSLPGTTCC